MLTKVLLRTVVPYLEGLHCPVQLVHIFFFGEDFKLNLAT